MPVDVTQLFQAMIRSGISDIHFKAGTAPVVRVHGRLISSGYTKMTAQHIDELAQALMSDEQRQTFQKERELDFAYQVPNLSRFRVNVYRQRGSVALSLRVVPLTLKTFEELGLPADTMRKLLTNTRGLLLVAGVTGAGKTTTLNAMIDHLNRTYAYNIVSVEDPIEFFHTDVKSSIAQREVGNDTDSFSKALKHILRQDPDVVVLGEMRDAEALRTGIAAAETGHLVLGTAHTMDASQTLDRLLESHGANEAASARVRIANVLKGIVCQRLMEGAEGTTRLPATEILMGTSLVRKLITDGKNAELSKAMEQGQYYGMHSFDQDIVRLYNEKKVTKEEAMDASSSPDDLVVKLNTLGG